VTTYAYNARGLLEEVDFEPPSTQPTYTTIADVPKVEFLYDNVGNRTQMTDGAGTQTYTYDELSRMTSETRTISGVTGSFTISYGYQLSGKLKSVTDPFGAVVNYNDDKTARTTSITGSNFAGVSTYASGIEYRAFGAVKELTYGSADSSVLSYEFDDRLRVSSYESSSSVLSGGYVRRATYEYFDDSRIKKVNNLLDAGLDQSYKFDMMGRMVSSSTGQKLNNEEELEEPFTQTISYNAFGDVTARTNEVWGAEAAFGATYVNKRKQGGNSIYDNSGNVVDKTTASNKYERWKFDAAGRNGEIVNRWYRPIPSPSIDQTQTIAYTFDGEGRPIKRVDTNDWFHTFPDTNSGTITSTEYYIRSTVLGGQVLTKLDGDAEKKVTLVYSGSAVFAEQRVIASTPGVYWRHEDPLTGSYGKIDAAGNYGGYADDSPVSVEYEPLGGAIPVTDPNYDLIPANLLLFKYAGDVNRPDYACFIDGIEQLDGSLCMTMLSNRTAEPNPTHAQPFSLGYWIDEDDPDAEPPPDTPGEDYVFMGGVRTTFVPLFNLSSLFSFSRVTATITYVLFRGVSGARAALQNLVELNNGECGNKLNELLVALRKARKGEDVRATDMMELFTDIQDGLLLNTDDGSYRRYYKELTGVDLRAGVGGGGGAAIAVPQVPNAAKGTFMLVGVNFWYYTGRPASYTSVSSSEKSQRIATVQTLMKRLVHELVHAAGKNSTFAHHEIGKAALQVDRSLTDTSNDGEGFLNQFIQKHCLDWIGEQ
jgi:YD repeat-containing protein